VAHQLNFLHLLEQTATILPFPPRRLHSSIRAAAQRVHAAPAHDQPQAMLNEIGMIMLRYIINGFSEDQAYQLVQGYSQAITAELYRLKFADHRPDPRGAA
jgi:hypothetical protein